MPYYSDLPKTTFPTSEQAFPVMLDIVAADGRNVKGFQEAMMAGNTDLARVYYDLIESADQKFVTADMPYCASRQGNLEHCAHWAE